jgi:hypothetical protein
VTSEASSRCNIDLKANLAAGDVAIRTQLPHLRLELKPHLMSAETNAARPRLALDRLKLIQNGCLGTMTYRRLGECLLLREERTSNVGGLRSVFDPFRTWA